VTDRHHRILRLVTQTRQRDLDEQQAPDAARAPASAARRRSLKRIANRSRVQVAQAEARRLPVNGSD
jgi:hypothetical protein